MTHYVSEQHSCIGIVTSADYPSFQKSVVCQCGHRTRYMIELEDAVTMFMLHAVEAAFIRALEDRPADGRIDYPTSRTPVGDSRRRFPGLGLRRHSPQTSGPQALPGNYHTTAYQHH